MAVLTPKANAKRKGGVSLTGSTRSDINRGNWGFAVNTTLSILISDSVGDFFLKH